MSDWREIAEWDWIEFARGSVLHAVGEVTNDVDEDWYGDGKTACGRSGIMYIPGMFTRMSLKRCERCCNLTGMPQGNQSPKNVDECRPVVEKRLKEVK